MKCNKIFRLSSLRTSIHIDGCNVTHYQELHKFSAEAEAEAFFDESIQELLSHGWYDIESIPVEENNKDIILYLTRLTDPKKQGKHENLVLEQLLEHSDIKTKPELLKELERQINALRDKSQNCRTIRDKSIAHQDLNRGLTQSSPYAGIEDVKVIEELLLMVNEFMKTVNQNLENEENSNAGQTHLNSVIHARQGFQLLVTKINNRQNLCPVSILKIRCACPVVRISIKISR